MATDTAALLDQIGNLTLTEAADLVKQMEEKFGISTAAAPVAVAAAPGAGGDAGGSDDDATFNVILESFGEKKIDVIKAVREATGLGLKEAKDMVEKGGQAVKEGLDKAGADELKGKLEAAGAKVKLDKA